MSDRNVTVALGFWMAMAFGFLCVAVIGLAIDNRAMVIVGSVMFPASLIAGFLDVRNKTK